jgi:hypothetical protein
MRRFEEARRHAKFVEMQARLQNKPPLTLWAKVVGGVALTMLIAGLLLVFLAKPAPEWRTQHLPIEYGWYGLPLVLGGGALMFLAGRYGRRRTQDRIDGDDA